MKQTFLNTAFASWLKVFISAMLLQVLNGLMAGHDIFTFDMLMVKQTVSAGVVALLPMIINYLNPNDPRFGKKNVEVAEKGATEAIDLLVDERLKK